MFKICDYNTVTTNTIQPSASNHIVRVLVGCPITSETQSIQVPLVFSEGGPGSLG